MARSGQEKPFTVRAKPGFLGMKLNFFGAQRRNLKLCLFHFFVVRHCKPRIHHGCDLCCLRCRKSSFCDIQGSETPQAQTQQIRSFLFPFFPPSLATIKPQCLTCSFLNPKEQELKQKVQDYQRSCFLFYFYFYSRESFLSFSSAPAKSKIRTRGGVHRGGMEQGAKLWRHFRV